MAIGARVWAALAAAWFSASALGAPIAAEDQAAGLGRGLSVLAFDPGWSDSGLARFKPYHFARIRAAGFATVKIVMVPQGHTDADGKPDAAWLSYLDGMVASGLDAGFTVVLDNFGFDVCTRDVEACGHLVDGFWSHLASHCRAAPERLLFSVLSEPHGAMTPACWNRQLRRTLAVIRASNPTRTVLVGPAEENAPAALPALDLPAEDRHLIAYFHYWAPMTFTHQGATWVGERYKNLHGVEWGSPEAYAQIRRDFDAVDAWAKSAHRPVVLESFGAYEPAGVPARARWTAAVAREAEAHAMSWIFWQFGSDFTVYDFGREAWVEPILHALVPPK